jgi:biopolymer transport protein ExbB/TolQ
VSEDIYDAIFAIAARLEVPVIVAALLALALVLFELGAYVVEAWSRRQRSFPRLAVRAADARRELDAGDRAAATATLAPAAASAGMAAALDSFVAIAGQPGADTRMAKELAEFDFGRQRRLARTRLLVRTGPALGLMGTLIPLSPALEGLADGNVRALTDNLRVAFSVTVLGLLVGAIAFALSLVRDRMYGQDYSDLEYVAAVLTDPQPPAASGTGAADTAPDRTAASS